MTTEETENQSMTTYLDPYEVFKQLPIVKFFRDKFGHLNPDTKKMLYHMSHLEGLSDLQRNTLIDRFITTTQELTVRTGRYSIIFHFGRFTVTVGSLLVPALLSIQYSSTTNISGHDMSMVIYWCAWVLSLFVTVCNGVLSLFKVDKKYYFLMATLESIRSEMWQYLHLSGRYGGQYLKDKPNEKDRIPTHANQYVFICYKLDQLKMHQVEEEYYKVVDAMNSSAANDLRSAASVANPQSHLPNMYGITPMMRAAASMVPLRRSQTQPQPQPKKVPIRVIVQGGQQETRPPLQNQASLRTIVEDEADSWSETSSEGRGSGAQAATAVSV